MAILVGVGIRLRETGTLRSHFLPELGWILAGITSSLGGFRNLEFRS